jgi:uncharacterized protein
MESRQHTQSAHFHAVYNGTKEFINSFAYALREEIRDTGVSITC